MDVTLRELEVRAATFGSRDDRVALRRAQLRAGACPHPGLHTDIARVAVESWVRWALSASCVACEMVAVTAPIDPSKFLWWPRQSAEATARVLGTGDFEILLWVIPLAGCLEEHALLETTYTVAPAIAPTPCPEERTKR